MHDRNGHLRGRGLLLLGKLRRRLWERLLRLRHGVLNGSLGRLRASSGAQIGSSSVRLGGPLSGSARGLGSAPWLRLRRRSWRRGRT